MGVIDLFHCNPVAVYSFENSLECANIEITISGLRQILTGRQSNNSKIITDR